MTIRVEAKDFERNERGYQMYDPKNQSLVCRLDLVRISQADNFLKPDKKDAKVYEAFFKYATDLHQYHPEWDSPKDIAVKFDLLKMSEIVPKAFEEYAQKVQPQKEVKSPEKSPYIKPQVDVYQ